MSPPLLQAETVCDVYVQQETGYVMQEAVTFKLLSHVNLSRADELATITVLVATNSRRHYVRTVTIEKLK